MTTPVAKSKMNLPKLSASILTIALIAISAISILASPVRAVTVSSVDISSAVAAENFAISYDSATNNGWISGKSANAMYKVSMGTVLAQGVVAVTTFPNIFPFSSGGGGVGNYVSGPLGNVVQGGLVWTTATYNSGDALASLNPSNSAVSVYYYPSGTTNFADISSDGSKLYMGEFQKIVVFNPAGSSFSSISTAPCTPNFIFPDGSLLRFTCDSGFGYVNNDGTGLYIFPTGSQSRYIAKDASGNIWFTSNFAHTLSICSAPCSSSSGITTYSTGIGGDGPFGLNPVSTGVWLHGYADKKVRFFSTLTNAIDPTQDITSSKRPYNGFIDSLSNFWSFALGSGELIQVPASSASPSITSSTTVTGTATSLSGTVTSTVTTTTTITGSPTTTATNECGGPAGAKCKWTPIVIPTIHVSSVNISGSTATISGFEFFLAGPSSGDFFQMVQLVGCCAMMQNLNPSDGTFATMSVTARPYNTNNYPNTPTPAFVINSPLIPTSETKFGWLCSRTGGPHNTQIPNSEYITDTVLGCWASGGSGALPINYRTFSFTAPTGTIVSIQATGTASQGQVSVYNLFL